MSFFDDWIQERVPDRDFTIEIDSQLSLKFELPADYDELQNIKRSSLDFVKNAPKLAKHPEWKDALITDQEGLAEVFFLSAMCRGAIVKRDDQISEEPFGQIEFCKLAKRLAFVFQSVYTAVNEKVTKTVDEGESTSIDARKNA